jgi:hypothetical protein
MVISFFSLIHKTEKIDSEFGFVRDKTSTFTFLGKSDVKEAEEKGERSDSGDMGKRRERFERT